MYIKNDTVIVEVPNEVTKVKLLLRPGTVLSPVDPLLLNATRTISSITVPLAVGNNTLPINKNVEAWIVDAAAMAALSIQAPAVDVDYEQVAPGAYASGSIPSVAAGRTATKKDVPSTKSVKKILTTKSTSKSTTQSASQSTRSHTTSSSSAPPSKQQRLVASVASEQTSPSDQTNPKTRAKVKRAAVRRKQAQLRQVLLAEHKKSSEEFSYG